MIGCALLPSSSLPAAEVAVAPVLPALTFAGPGSAAAMNFSEVFKLSSLLCKFSPDGKYLVSGLGARGEAARGPSGTGLNPGIRADAWHRSPGSGYRGSGPGQWSREDARSRGAGAGDRAVVPGGCLEQEPRVRGPR